MNPLTRLRSSQSGALGILLLFGVVLVALAVSVKLQQCNVTQGGLPFFVNIAIQGLANGAIYALIALGYTMVYGIIELINFAHGDVFTLGAFFSLPLLGLFGLTEGKEFTIVTALLLLLVLVIVMALTGGVNVLIERVAYRPLRNSPRLAPLITAVGMSFILEGIMFLWRGPFNLHYPDILPATRVNLLGNAYVGIKDMVVVGVAIVLVIALSLFVNRSKLGKAMRATAQDRDASQLMGIDINRTIAATFFIGAVLAAAGGIIYGLYFNSVDFQLGFSAGLVAFTAAVFGGIGNIQGAALGGLIIGMLQAYNDGYCSSAWTRVLIFGILILVLVFRPSGLLGSRLGDKA
ncbi:MAG TPA: branched-chain amino acid ABC transporter permease [Candidatus Dormibacteraeota bacterium]|jgi:branched-chain amino acid transport system permease protein|nr:branched-chain amino acid ABC transporter permease [Candidatus Dormibacteraeota bacterium]